jgi:hypothetical protein
MDYKSKYLKYKTKYLSLRKIQKGGVISGEEYRHSMSRCIDEKYNEFGLEPKSIQLPMIPTMSMSLDKDIYQLWYNLKMDNAKKNPEKINIVEKFSIILFIKKEYIKIRLDFNYDNTEQSRFSHEFTLNKHEENEPVIVHNGNTFHEDTVYRDIFLENLELILNYIFKKSEEYLGSKGISDILNILGRPWNQDIRETFIGMIINYFKTGEIQSYLLPTKKVLGLIKPVPQKHEDDDN